MKKQDNSGIVVLVSGASSGIGKSTAEYLSQLGYRVYGTSRRPRDYPQPEKYALIEMDVRDSASVNAAVETVLRNEGHIDVLVNNAGYGIGGPVEETDPRIVEQQLDTNFFGLYRVLHRVLKEMRRQGSGRIINMSSIGGRIGLPYQGIYSASKFAVEGLTEALYKELHGSGIRVLMIEPGDYKTGFTARREMVVPDELQDRMAQSRRIIEHDEQSGRPPLEIAQLIDKVIRKKYPRLRYPVGAFDQKLSLFLKRILPDSCFDRIIMQYYKVKSGK
ncbi:MAG: SDR family NAD(P)-dependent oxidoreductase [Candidatus Neomarinimicrobiota bacterium]|jgi:NAD(P)-dependent dehydrogenase (short-subunit alcohol dehydrogenase family)|nr:SDR family NAD(P)-dependent oxidoreductase [Candidatus Neomarinimicrobiota bacterium]MDD3966615.1 SDR family NAD(P)-dependent oxidoreductase [Candidatus Neomarinimicrobiota bacterium]MDX9780340.1 SDR family NAD(P)-dependent oxidoreductase [bacterium]